MKDAMTAARRAGYDVVPPWVLRYLWAVMDCRREGVTPTFDHLKAMVGDASKNAAFVCINRLVKAGLLRRGEFHAAATAVPAVQCILAERR